MFGLYSTQLSHTAAAAGPAVPFGTTGIGELREGAMGSAVRELQSKLNVLQYGPVNVDGTFGAGTKQALQNFQQAEGLGVTGVLDAETEARLNQRILNVSTGGEQGVNPQTGLPAQPTPTRPWWQTALMVAGGVAIAGGIIYLLSEKADGSGYKRALNSRTVDHDPSASTRYKRAVTAHGSTLRGAHSTREKCDRTPSNDAFENGEALEVPTS